MKIHKFLYFYLPRVEKDILECIFWQLNLRNGKEKLGNSMAQHIFLLLDHPPN